MHKRALRLMPLVIVMGLLNGCETDRSSPVVVTCPTLIEYDQRALDKLADEIDALPRNSLLPLFMADYAGLRAQVRACRAVNGD